MRISSFLSVVVLASIAAGCSHSDSAKPGVDSAAGITPGNFTISAAQRARIHLVTVEPTTYQPKVQATGNVAFNGDKSTQVLSPVSGPAVRVVGDVGMRVTQGQPLAYVSSPDFASAVAAYRKAQSAYRQAKITASRDSALFANDALARADLEQAQTDLASADADVESAVQAMRALGVEEPQIEAVRDGKTAAIQAIIRSPINGTIVEKLIANGQLLQAGTTPCFTVADLSTMWVYANVYANDLPNVAVGEAADIYTDVARAPIPGHVDYIASLADPNTKAVQVRVLASNTNQVLRRDMFVKVEINSSVQHRGILVPTSSVMRDDENLPYVYVAVGTSYQRRRIDLGSQVGDQYEVKSGLNPGDKVVAEGALFLQFAETQ